MFNDSYYSIWSRFYRHYRPVLAQPYLEKMQMNATYQVIVLYKRQFHEVKNGFKTSEDAMGWSETQYDAIQQWKYDGVAHVTDARSPNMAFDFRIIVVAEDHV